VTTAVIPAGGLARVRDRFATYPAYGSFLDELGEIVGSLTLYAPVLEPGYAEYDYHAAYVLNPKWCQVIPLPAHPRGEPGLAFLRNYSVQFRTFLREVPQWRRALIYTPSATASLAVTAWRLTRAHPDRAVAYVWGDWQQLSAVLPQRGIARWLLNPFQRRIILRQERWLVEHADVTVVAGPALGGKYQAVGKRVVETVPIIKMGELKNPRPTVGRIPNRLLTVGRVVPGKGVEVLLKTVSILRRSTPVTLRIVGGGDPGYLRHLAHFAASAGVQDAVAFAGVLPNGPQLWREYQEAAVFVCPSLSEGFPRVLYESMALGTPIVSTAVGGIPGVLANGEQALLVRPGDAEQLAQACQRVLSDPDLASRLADEGRALFDRIELAAAGESPAMRIARFLTAPESPTESR